jgi:broad specificity phosphatase PhoE
LVLITKEKSFEKQKLIDTFTSLMLPKVHALVFTHKDFIAMLLDKKLNFGKEIFNNRLIFRNASSYYVLIKEAIENGFRG